MQEDLRDIYYTVIHCDADWQPSVLTTMEYLDGFDEEQFDQYGFSINTLTEFTTYQLTLPNERFRWTKSGNYILVVYQNEQRSKSHQELDFTVTFEGINVDDPKKEIHSTILQNGRWDNAVTNLPPQFVFRDRVVYDYQNKIVFPAGKEFRFIDLRTFSFKSEGVAAIDEYQDIYLVEI